MWYLSIILSKINWSKETDKLINFLFREALLRHPELSMEMDRLSDTLSETGERLPLPNQHRGMITLYDVISIMIWYFIDIRERSYPISVYVCPSLCDVWFSHSAALEFTLFSIFFRRFIRLIKIMLREWIKILVRYIWSTNIPPPPYFWFLVFF